MPKWFTPTAAVCALMFAFSPILIGNAPFEPTMMLVQKIFYYHLPSAFMFLIAAVICGIASVRFLFGGSPKQDRLAWAAAELVVLFGALTLVTGPLWARKAWGVWWQWDVRLTSSLMGWMVAVAYLLVRRFGGPGSDKLAAGLALFGMAIGYGMEASFGGGPRYPVECRDELGWAHASHPVHRQYPHAV